MFEYIEKLRGKSDRTKKLVALGAAGLCAGIILFFWFFSVFPDMRQQKQISDRVESTTPSPISAFAQIISQGTSGIKEQLANIKSASSGFFGVTEIKNTATSTEATSTNQVTATSTGSIY